MKLNEKGSVTMIVVVTIFFIVILLSSFLIYTSSRRRAQLEETEKISEAYDGDMEEIYSKVAGKEAENASAEASLFDTSYGRIEVVWLDLENNIIDEPLAPNTKGMTPIKWEGTTEVETTEDDEDWYEYVAGIGTDDNLRSKWANVKDENGSYFVWIPRYAYRITYYPDETSTKVSGYCDGRGIVDSNGKMQYPLDEGIKTVEKDGVSYIVHPAFMDDKIDQYTHGGWDIDLPGIWVGKYETSEINNSLKIIPNARPKKSLLINECYNLSKGYNSSRESHLIKNSEWGAISYLTHSQYGRNGHEIDYNNSYEITGNSSGSSNTSSSDDIKYAYDTLEGQKASSTGNIYGIYDLSGGCSEYVAMFNSKSSNEDLDTGNSFASTGKQSSKYETAYYNQTDEENGEIIYTIGKIGDATKEVFGRQKYIFTNWNKDIVKNITLKEAFLNRGYSPWYGTSCGIFSMKQCNGGVDYSTGFRIIIVTN